MSDVISVRLEKGDVKRIKEITKKLYYSQSIADYVRKVVGESIKQDESVIESQKNGGAHA